MKVLTLVLAFNFAYAGRKIHWRHIEAAERQGPNVCAVELVDGTDYTYYTDCKYWSPRQICGKETSIRYICCAGYYKVPGTSGCVGVRPLTDVVDTARRAGATKFARLLEASGLANELSYGSAVTLFAPSDESIDRYLRTLGNRLEWSNGNDGRYADLVANHLVNKRLLSNQWPADSLIETRLPGHALRINKYSNAIETVNCKRIVRKNWEATNGIVHVIDGILEPALSRNSDVIDLAARDGRFTIFANALEASELGRKIRSGDTAYTVFAPTDEAFHRIPRDALSAILTDKEAMEALVAHHVVSHPICAPSVISEHHANTMQRQVLTLNCGFRGPVVQNSRLEEVLYHGSNGLLYMLNNVILPNRAKTVLQLAYEEGLFTFLQIVRAAGLEDMLTDLKDYTMFAPSETAMYSMSNRQLSEIQRNRESARNFVLTHIAVGKHLTGGITSNQVATSLNRNIPLRFQVYRGNFGVENALIKKVDKEGRNGVLQVISHVLHPQTNSLDQVLRADGHFNTWLDAMDRMRTIEPRIYEELNNLNSSCTYFLPTDEAFSRLGESELVNLLQDNQCLSQTLKNHMAENMMISESFKPDLQYHVKTKQNMLNIVRKDDRMSVNGAPVTKCDILNNNGVVHEIDTVLLPTQCYLILHAAWGANSASHVPRYAKTSSDHSIALRRNWTKMALVDGESLTLLLTTAD